MNELFTCVKFYSQHPHKLLFRNQDSHITNADSEQSHVPVKSADSMHVLYSACATMESDLSNKSTEDVLKTSAFSNDPGKTIVGKVDDDSVFMEPTIPSAAVRVAKTVSNETFNVSHDYDNLSFLLSFVACNK